MVEKARRAKVEESRPDADPAWEILARDEADDPPRYVGTVRAADAEAAHEEATRLFCWYAHEVWVCPAREIRKFSADAEEETELAVPESGTEGRTHEL
ncbi:Htur_1727 family rSAM-partnered candidate RiPP [Halorussus aquaticus]|uniref:Htur_1727 family rSAM-partnered candidate RiPP n=1 Tax=Halorussus aquaticus TaxID=2953748 RepID=A0ABD5PXJ2_9EURY|nr:Htur_1727 family rSAM-partnered candidate RiPP [Halorussus aquaticus]